MSAPRNIVNREIVNLQNCDEEPIHIPGSIQPHGFLIAVNNAGEVTFCSENVSFFVKAGPAEVLGKPIAQFVGADGANKISNAAEPNQTKTVYKPVRLSIGDSDFSCLVNKSSSGYLLLEFEAAYQPAGDAADLVFDQTLRFINYMEGSMNLQQLCEKVAAEIRNLTAYDRVMIYRFGKDYSGEVFAEAKREDLESFFGLRYPASDIPVQARKLYETNLLRIIPDVAYKPVPLLTNIAGDNTSLDLSFSVLRSVSPIHVQYLLNMGVVATLTISLMHKGKLWGLIACHHYSEKYIDHNTRVLAQLQGNFITSQIEVRQQVEEYSISREMSQALDAMSELKFEPTPESVSYIACQPQLLQLCNATGVAIITENEIFTQGKVPTKRQIRDLDGWLIQNNKQGSFYTHHLSSVFPEAKAYCGVASGILFHELSIYPRASIIWFNQETIEEVKWGGDPEKAIIKDENGLHPRKSFEQWKQVIQCKAREWRAAELTSANTFANNLQKHLSLVMITAEERAQRDLSEKLHRSNLELENINWIGTHDLKEPLRKIQLFTSRIMEKEQSITPNTLHSLQRVNAAANRMAQLINDLTTLGKLSSEHREFSMVNMQECIAEVQKEYADEIAEGTVIFTTGADMPEIKGTEVLIRQLWVNLVGNAVKFRKENVAARIEIGYEGAGPHPDAPPEEHFHIIYIRDNGIGFDKKFSADIFKIFKRLNNASKYQGSGIGLALCSKIMQIHNGHIGVSSAPGEGTIFRLYFPV